jgi:site-specific recombinase XerD
MASRRYESRGHRWKKDKVLPKKNRFAVTPHRLRGSHATELFRLGANPRASTQALGQKNIRTTLRYVQVTQQDLPRISREL